MGTEHLLSVDYWCWVSCCEQGLTDCLRAELAPQNIRVSDGKAHAEVLAAPRGAPEMAAVTSACVNCRTQVTLMQLGAVATAMAGKIRAASAASAVPQAWLEPATKALDPTTGSGSNDAAGLGGLYGGQVKEVSFVHLVTGHAMFIVIIQTIALLTCS